MKRYCRQSAHSASTLVVLHKSDHFIVICIIYTKLFFYLCPRVRLPTYGSYLPERRLSLLLGTFVPFSSPVNAKRKYSYIQNNFLVILETRQAARQRFDKELQGPKFVNPSASGYPDAFCTYSGKYAVVIRPGRRIYKFRSQTKAICTIKQGRNWGNFERGAQVYL